MCCALGIKRTILDKILSNIDVYYYEKRKEKYRNGKLKTNKEGTPRYRIINPSVKELKVIQGRINRFLSLNIAFAPFVFGATKGKDNVLNAKTHRW